MDRGSADPGAVGVAYIEATGQQRFDDVAALLGHDFEGWTGGRAFDRVAWVEALRGFGPILDHNDVRTTIVDRDQVCVVYDLVTTTAVGVVPCAELIVVADGLITSTRLVFEFAHWPEVMAERDRRLKGTP